MKVIKLRIALTVGCVIHCILTPLLAGFGLFNENRFVEFLILFVVILTLPKRIMWNRLMSKMDWTAFFFTIAGVTIWVSSTIFPLLYFEKPVGPVVFLIGTLLEHRNWLCHLKPACHCKH